MAVVVLAHKILNNDGLIVSYQKETIKIFPLLFVNFSVNLNSKHWSAVIIPNYKFDLQTTFGNEFDPEIEKHLNSEALYMLVPFTEWADIKLENKEHLALMLEMVLEMGK